MDTKPLLMRRGADGGLQSTSATNKMRDTPAVRGRIGCIYLLAQLVLWYLCRTSAHSHVRCLRTTPASQVLSDSLSSGSWRATRGKANSTRWQLCIQRVPTNRSMHPTGRGLSCIPGCLQCSSCLDRLKLQPLAKQMFSSSMLSELQLNRTTTTSHPATHSTCLPERKVAPTASAQPHWSYTPGLQAANRWIWRPWTEGLGRWKHSYTSICTWLQAVPYLGWQHKSDGYASLVRFCRLCFFCDAALLSHARPNVVSVFACDAVSRTLLAPCAKLSSFSAPRWLILHFEPRLLCWYRMRSAQSNSSIRLWLHLRPGADQCASLPRLEESSPGAYFLACAPVSVAASCYPAPRLEVSSPGAWFTAEIVACCQWLSTLCCRLEVSSPVTQRFDSFLGIAPDAIVCRPWYLPPSCELNHSCSPSWAPINTCAQTLCYSLSLVDLMLWESAAQWTCVRTFQSASCQMCLIACSCPDSLPLRQPGLVLILPCSSSGWISELLHVSPLEPWRSGLWMPERLGPLRGRAFFRRLWLALRTKRPHLSRRRIPWESQGPSSRLLWLRRVCHRPRHRRCILAETIAPWRLLRRRPLRSRLRLQRGRDPGRTWHLCAQARPLRRLLRLPATSCLRLVPPKVSTYLCLDHVLSPCRPFPGGTRSRYRWTQCHQSISEGQGDIAIVWIPIGTSSLDGLGWPDLFL